MDFGGALKHLRGGGRVTRRGWNGMGMWICLSPGMESVRAEDFWAMPNRAFAVGRGGTATVRPYITMKCADDTIVPWFASQSDMLAEDWEGVP
jgi:hypothetical protein